MQFLHSQSNPNFKEKVDSNPLIIQAGNGAMRPTKCALPICQTQIHERFDPEKSMVQGIGLDSIIYPSLKATN